MSSVISDGLHQILSRLTRAELQRLFMYNQSKLKVARLVWDVSLYIYRSGVKRYQEAKDAGKWHYAQ